MSGSNGNEPLMNSDIMHDNHDDEASQSSQRSIGGRSVSLLERIQRQRELETTATTTGSTGNSTGAANHPISSLIPQQQIQPQQIFVPQYGPMPGFGNNTNGSIQQPQILSTEASPQQGYLNNAWNNFTQNMESSMMASKSQLNLPSSSSSLHENDEMHHALLPPTSNYSHVNTGDHNVDEYSISQYFLTFVKDIYGLFVWMPIVARFFVVIGLLYIVVKLI